MATRRGPPRRDGGRVGRRDLGPATFDPRSPPSCDPSRHVDCFFNVECRDGMVRMTSGRPYPCCNDAQCQAALNANVCWGTRLACPEGCGRASLALHPERLLGARRGAAPSDLCAGGGKAPGAARAAARSGRARAGGVIGTPVRAFRRRVRRRAGTGCLAARLRRGDDLLVRGRRAGRWPGT
ncbi:MAG: hypothetical protein IPF99_20810 [Deltaproteobacteria bacterium]|nr:hypothetical protein [Deltaproteobacteria bacterium]